MGVCSKFKPYLPDAHRAIAGMLRKRPFFIAGRLYLVEDHIESCLAFLWGISLGSWEPVSSPP